MKDQLLCAKACLKGRASGAFAFFLVNPLDRKGGTMTCGFQNPCDSMGFLPKLGAMNFNRENRRPVVGGRAFQINQVGTSPTRKTSIKRTKLPTDAPY